MSPGPLREGAGQRPGQLEGAAGQERAACRPAPALSSPWAQSPHCCFNFRELSTQLRLKKKKKKNLFFLNVKANKPKSKHKIRKIKQNNTQGLKDQYRSTRPSGEWTHMPAYLLLYIPGLP